MSKTGDINAFKSETTRESCRCCPCPTVQVGGQNLVRAKNTLKNMKPFNSFNSGTHTPIGFRDCALLVHTTGETDLLRLSLPIFLLPASARSGSKTSSTKLFVASFSLPQIVHLIVHFFKI